VPICGEALEGVARYEVEDRSRVVARRSAPVRRCENRRMTTDYAFVLRAAELRDVAAIVGLIRELADFEKLTHLVQVTPEKLRPQLFGEHAAAEALVAERGGEVVAFALFFKNFSTFLARPGIYLEDLYVKPEHRGHGIGKALLNRLAALAVERDCGRFEWSVLDWNVDAIRLYEGMGASVMPEWRICRVTGDALQSMGAKPDASAAAPSASAPLQPAGAAAAQAGGAASS
jgi:GNAT superfamily N-acetyltransferase